ncbi:hypothetical protein ACHAXT_005049 [Thalassiosira profunda]
MPRPGRLLSSVLALVGVAVVPLASASEPCQCTFTSADPPNCVAYGQLGDGNLIPWTVASQDCLNLYKIKDGAVDPATLEGMFPNPDGTGGSPSAFVNYLRFDSGSVASGIKAGFPQFWEESATTAGKMELKDEIIVGGETVACSSDMGGSESDCYNAMKDYFAVDPGAAEMAGVGQQLHNAAAVSREKEQSLARIRLCEEGGAAECGATSEQVLEVKAANPDKFCSAYALGPAGYSYPKCVVDVGIIGSGPTTPPGSSAAVSLKFVGTAALILLGAIVTCGV